MRSHRELLERLRRIQRKAGGKLLQPAKQGFEKLPHGLKGIVIEQRSHPLPQQAFAAELGPDRLKQRTTALLGLIHQKRQHHQHGKHHREILLAMPVVVLKVIALVFQRIEGFVFDLPPGSSTSHEPKDVALVHPPVRHPTEVSDLVMTNFPVLDEIDPYVRVRSIEWHVIDKAKPMTDACGAIVPLISSHVSIVCSSLHLIEQIGVIAFFDSKDIVTPVSVEGLDVRGVGTQTVFGDKELEMGVILAQLDNEAL